MVTVNAGSQMVPTADQLRRVVTPVERVKMSRALIEHHRGEMAKMAAVRRDALRELRTTYTVAEISELCGLKPAQVYALLDEKPKPARASDPSWTLEELVRELRTSAAQARNVAEGRTPSIAMGTVGSRFLADELEAASRMLVEMSGELRESATTLDEAMTGLIRLGCGQFVKPALLPATAPGTPVTCPSCGKDTVVDLPWPTQ
jgi:hypothetical protein